MTWNALYYPDCELPNDSWMLTAALYWDTISYLVPIEEKDEKRPSLIEQLALEKIVVPIVIRPSMQVVKDASKKFVDAKNIEEIQKMIRHDKQHGNKESGRSVRRSRPRGKSGWHAQAIMQDLSKTIVGSWSGGSSHIDLNIFRMYMLVLASEYREQNNLSLITNTSLKYFAGIAAGEALACEPVQGVLAHLILKSIGLKEDTKLNKVLKFKEKHQDQLARFRLSIEKMSLGLKEVDTLEKVYSKADEINLEIRDSELELRSKLKENEIETFVEGMGLTIPLAIGFAALAPIAVMAAPAIPLLVRATKGLINKWGLENNAPYAYVLAAKRNLIHGQNKYQAKK